MLQWLPLGLPLLADAGRGYPGVAQRALSAIGTGVLAVRMKIAPRSSSSRVVCPKRGLAEEFDPGFPTERTREDICSPR